MTDKFPKYVEYRGITLKLDKYGKLKTQYSYRLDKRAGGMGYLSEGAARKAAEKAVDRRLKDEAGK